MAATLTRFAKEERGAILADPLTALALGLLAFLAQLHDPGTLATLALAALPVVAGVAAGAGGGRGELKMERNFARDHLAFRCPARREDVEKEIRQQVYDHQRNYIEEAAWWRWPGDKREFLIPREFIPYLPKMHLVRDVLAAVTTLWYEQKPRDRKIYTTLREMAQMISIAPNGAHLKEIYDALVFLRSFTIINQEVVTKLDRTGKKKESRDLVWGFISYVAIITMRDGKRLPENKRPVEICITEPYAALLSLLPPAAVPGWWLETARKLPRRQVAHAKNLLYRLAGERKLPAEWKESTIVEIADFRSERKVKRHQAVRDLLNALEATGVLNYQERQGTDGEPVYVIYPKRDPIGQGNATQ